MYRDTNNIHAFIPVLTKPHQFLGTFSEEEEEEEEQVGERGGRQGAPSSTRRTHERTRSEQEPAAARQPLQGGQPLQQGGAADQAQGAVADSDAHVSRGDGDGEAPVPTLPSLPHLAS